MRHFDDVALHDTGHIDIAGIGSEGMHDIFASNDAEQLIALHDGEIGLIRSQDVIDYPASAVGW